jgi:hypothetical protein
VSELPLSYVLPLRWSGGDRRDLGRYLEGLGRFVDEIIVVDGSDPGARLGNAEAWGTFVTHLRPDPEFACLNGKVAGVVTGVVAARNEKIVVADDDVRYDRAGLERVADLLDEADLVRPQNHFTEPLPWHAVVDTARSLLDRAWGRDYPGTFGLRRSHFLGMGGYDGDVLFENLELIRTVVHAGGREAAPLDLYVARIPPDTERYLSQRVRQAYDDFALPVRMAAWLSIVPLLATKRRTVLAGAACAMAIAELGRRRGGGASYFTAASSLAAPLWLLERGICAWLAVGRRLTGGVPYSNGKIVTAANRVPPVRPPLPEGNPAGVPLARRMP